MRTLLEAAPCGKRLEKIKDAFGNRGDDNDSYPTCELTHATLRVYSDTMSPEEMATALRVTPTSLSPQQCKRIAELGVDCWFDVYLGGDNDEERRNQGQ